MSMSQALARSFGSEYSDLSADRKAALLSDFSAMCRDEYDVGDPTMSDCIEAENITEAATEYRRRVGIGNLVSYTDCLLVSRKQPNTNAEGLAMNRTTDTASTPQWAIDATDEILYEMESAGTVEDRNDGTLLACDRSDMPNFAAIIARHAPTCDIADLQDAVSAYDEAQETLAAKDAEIARLRYAIKAVDHHLRVGYKDVTVLTMAVDQAIGELTDLSDTPK